MRKLKFRIWDKKFKRWMAEDAIHMNLEGSKFIDGLGLNKLLDQQIKEDCVIQQFIGLVDGEGKEIYEGDILIWEEQYVPVKWSYQMLLNIFNYDKSKLKVIGNIFDNPELLN